MTFCGAELRSGFDLVAETLALEEKVAACDFVITGEGRLDSQTLDGKGPGGVAAMAQRAGKPVLALAGSLEEGPISHLFDLAFAIVEPSVPLEVALARAEEFLASAAATAARRLRLGEIAFPGREPASQLVSPTPEFLST